MGKIWLGCSGWDYRDWADVFYKSTDKSRRWHGRGEKMWYNYRYSKDELADWMPKLKEMSQNTDVYRSGKAVYPA